MLDDHLMRLPWWARRLDELRAHFTNKGLGGLFDHHRITNQLGELLANGTLQSVTLASFLDHQTSTGAPPLPRGLHPIQMTDGWIGYHTDPRLFWLRVWKRVLGINLDIPPVCKFTQRQWEKIREYKLMLVYLPKISEDVYPDSFKKVDWNWFGALSLERLPLKGGWVLVEIIEVEHPIYYSGSDPLGASLGRTTTRTGLSWNELERNFPHIAESCDFKCPVRFLSLEERNLIGNVFVWLNDQYNMQLPNLGGNLHEWCQNSINDGHQRPLAGCSGLGAVEMRRADLTNQPISFRLLFDL